MSDDQWTTIDQYLTDAFVGPDDALDAALRDGAAAGLPAIDVAPNQGKLLHLLARMQGARRILELGTLAGYSTIWLARALPDDGRLISLEAEPGYAEVARGNIARAGLDDRVEVRVGAALETLPQLAAEDPEPFDLVFLDADKAGTPEYFAWALRLARPGTAIVADNVVRGGRILDADSGDPSVQGMRRFVDLAGAEPRVAATAIQTVGSKGHDGFVLALVDG